MSSSTVNKSVDKSIGKSVGKSIGKSIGKSVQESDSKHSNITKSKIDLTKFKGKTIVFTGFRDKEIEQELEQIGSKITNSVSKNTNIVVAADPDENSNKINKAKELEIEIMSKEEFYKTIGM